MQSKLSIFWSVLTVSALFLSGCGQAKPQEVSVDVSCDEFMEIQSIRQETEAAVGGLLVITLCSNPTTGFKWEAAEISDQTALEETSHKFVSPEEDKAPPHLGAAGKEVWTFKALEAGTSTISIAYSRPWEGGEKAAWTYDLTVVVK
jgi:inhibitor of cysteine peptidase